VSASDLAIVAALVFAWGTLSARLERFDVTASITFMLAAAHARAVPFGVLAHGVTADPLARRYGPRLTTVMGPAVDIETLHERRLIRRAA
jgi:hypothetical protein